MIFDKAITRQKPLKNETSPGIMTLTDPAGWTSGQMLGSSSEYSMKLSAVNACVEIISNTMSKLPVYVLDETTKEHIKHPLLHLLQERPNEAMTPSVYKKLMECSRLKTGNAYALIVRSGYNARPQEIIPIPAPYMQPWIDDSGELWYIYTNPRTGDTRKLEQWDVLHYKAYSPDGINGVSVLSRAKMAIESGLAAQKYQEKFYEQNAQPSGVLTIDTELKPEAKDKVREQWDKMHSGVDNQFRTAVLDLGLKYQPISVSNKDAQFVESHEVTVIDIARFFGVPPYKLYAGKQSYSSNEQNGIEYVTSTIHPIVEQCDEEDTYKLLFDSEIRGRMSIRRNMMAELKGDTNSRGNWYRAMREVGVFAPNDICKLEDMPSVPGGDTRYASLNYVPLDLFRKLSINRNSNEKGGNGE